MLVRDSFSVTSLPGHQTWVRLSCTRWLHVNRSLLPFLPGRAAPQGRRHVVPNSVLCHSANCRPPLVSHQLHSFPHPSPCRAHSFHPDFPTHHRPLSEAALVGVDDDGDHPGGGAVHDFDGAGLGGRCVLGTGGGDAAREGLGIASVRPRRWQAWVQVPSLVEAPGHHPVEPEATVPGYDTSPSASRHMHGLR